jgi:hypothetical protein
VVLSTLVKGGFDAHVDAKGHRFESTQLVSSTSVGAEEEIVDLVVNTSFMTHDMV